MVLSQHPWSILVLSLENKTDVQTQRLGESEKNTDTAWAGTPEIGEECEARLTPKSYCEYNQCVLAYCSLPLRPTGFKGSA